jgi:hypothetical protein
MVTQHRTDAKKPPLACKQPMPDHAHGAKAGIKTPKVKNLTLKVAPAAEAPQKMAI